MWNPISYFCYQLDATGNFRNNNSIWHPLEWFHDHERYMESHHNALLCLRYHGNQQQYRREYNKGKEKTVMMMRNS